MLAGGFLLLVGVPSCLSQFAKVLLDSLKTPLLTSVYNSEAVIEAFLGDEDVILSQFNI